MAAKIVNTSRCHYQNSRLVGNAPDDVVAQFADVQIGLYLDADATSGDCKGNIIGVCIISGRRKEMDLLQLLGEILTSFDSKGQLKKEGMAVCLVMCKGVAKIYVMGKEGVKMKGAEQV